MRTMLQLAGLVMLMTLAFGCGEDLAGFESTPLTCKDRLDNDGDGLVDCADPECRDQPVCQTTDNAPATEGDQGVPDAGVSDAEGATADGGVEHADGGAVKLADAAGAQRDATTADLEAADGAVVDGTQTHPEDDAAAGPACDEPCNQPPSPCYEPIGRCGSDGSCVYEPLDGTRCDDGNPCTDDDSCAKGACQGKPRVCNTPPPAGCVEGTLLGHAGVGRCVEGQCTYEARQTRCAYGCDAAGKGCAGDPCARVECRTPPSACFQAVGVCAQGNCRYLYADGASCDDGDACTERDSCVSGVCAGQQKRCSDPPASACRDERTLVTYGEQGTCTDGRCSYGQQTVDCPYGCDSEMHRCNGDPCEGVSCRQPPSACYKSEGICRLGRCSYEPADGQRCDDGNPCTINDTCTQGICSGQPKVCTDPPAPSCLSDTQLLAYRSPGQCREGKCDYPPVESSCAFGCEGDACLGDPCADVTCLEPPNKQCYAQEGICSGGQCRYVPTDGATCDDGDRCTLRDSCVGGECRGIGISCTNPPAPKCKDRKTITVFGEGQCRDGECYYAPTDQPCNTPPRAYCKDSATLVYYPDPDGFCIDNTCLYKEATTTCKGICRAGQCLVIIDPIPLPRVELKAATSPAPR